MATKSCWESSKTSQASNKVKWCLNKAKRELEESRVHRGLLRQEPDEDLAEMHVAKAEHNLKAATYSKERKNLASLSRHAKKSLTPPGK